MTFKELGLAEPILRALEAEGYTHPTPIQEKAVPILLRGKDLLGVAQTSTGKTAAFGIPILHHLYIARNGSEPSAQGAGHKGGRNIKALVVTPTRELAIQIGESFTAYGKFTGLRNTVIFGGVKQGKQTKALQQGVDILIATPGRLLDLMGQGYVSFRDLEFAVLDEADQMLDMGFIHALRQIAPKLPAERQTLLFSATMPKEMEGLAATYLDHPVRVQVATSGQTADKVTQVIHFVAKAEKPGFLLDLLRAHPNEAALVFARTKHGSDRLAKQLTNAGVHAVAIHGNRSQNQRMRALEAFASGEAPVLVATDVAARGLDIPAVRHVYNYELPNVPETYVHRIGRTARAGRDGAAITLCAPGHFSR